MKKQVGIFIFEEAEVLDFAGPFEVFSVCSEVHHFTLFDVCTISKSTKRIRAVNGLSVNPDFDFSNHPKLDILILAGGSGTRPLLDDVEVMDWIKKTVDDTEITLSICSAARMLGQLGYLDNNPYCTHHLVYEHLAEICPIGIPRPEKRYVESTSGIYTSGGISAGIDLSFHLIEKIHDRKTVEATAAYMEYRLEEY